MSLKVLINGCRGRMGQALISGAARNEAQVVAGIDVGDKPGDYLSDCEVIIDFSDHTATAGLVELAAQNAKPVVIGTTGHSEEETQRILKATKEIPVIWAGNYSIGVNLLQFLTRRAAEILGDAYAAEILELHHRHKKDAPSGTAMNLAETICQVRDQAPGDVLSHGRSGVTGARTSAELGMHAIRGGEIVGEHTVFFIGDSDRIELTHRASDRGIFVDGAYRAARWLVSQPAGLYSMQDVLGLSEAK